MLFDRNRPYILAFVAAAAFLLLAADSTAAIYMDEDFEGYKPFLDKKFPVISGSAQPALPLAMGLNLRVYSSDLTTTPVEMESASGTVRTSRAYEGTHCCRLVSGQRLAVKPGRFPYRNGSWFRVWQFALNTDTSFSGLPAGTRLGYFKIDYSTDGLGDLVPDVSILLALLVNGSGGADLVCVNKENLVLGSLTGAEDNWLLVTIVAMNKLSSGAGADTTEGWAAYDPLTSTYKGPQPPDLLHPTEPLLSTGVHIYVDGSSFQEIVLSRAGELGSAWGIVEGGAATTAEIGWEFVAENGGTLYLDNLYWDGGLHQSFSGGMDREQAARLTQFGGASAPTLPGIDTSIKRVYMVCHPHLDIGFTKPPEVVADQYKTMIDQQIQFAKSHPDYKWTVEETWALEQWLRRSTTEEIENLVTLVREEQIHVAGGHSTMHSARLGAEEMNRLLWNAARYRNLHGFDIKTVFHDDVPAVNWSYPQVLSKSGIPYLVVGENLFIGGGITQPYKSYIFRWEGPDKSRILTWSARESYAQGCEIFWWTAEVNEAKLAAVLNDLTGAGYPYDAVMIQTAFDNAAGTGAYDNAKKWNSTHSNPLIVVAAAEDFFEYMEEKYSEDIPVHSGNWICNWDTGGNEGPHEKKIAKNGHTLVPVAEQMNALANDRGLGGYDSALFDTAWDQILQIDEHSGPGGCWSEYWTQAEVDAANEQHRQYALEAFNATSATLSSGIENLLSAAAIPTTDSVIIYNPLSWTRTDLARVPLPPALFWENFTLLDPSQGRIVPCQKDVATSSLLFIASDVPPVGFKRYWIRHSPQPPVTTSLSASSRTLENDYYLVMLNDWGYVSGIFDKTAGREMVNTSGAFQFNRMIQGTNLQWFFGVNDPVPDPPSQPVIAISRTGPVAASLRATRTGHPHAGAEIFLYDGMDRIDLVNTPDRSRMLYASLSDNSRSYGLTFPFNLASPEARIDTAAGWCNPRTEMLEGSYRAAFAIQNCLDLSEPDYGVTFATPDVYVHAFGGFQNYGSLPPANPTVVSTFIRYGDEADIIGPTPGTVDVEPGAPLQWDLQFSIRSHARGFDSRSDARFGWEICAPLQGSAVPAGDDGLFPGDSLSFLGVDADNVLITSVKKADFGEGLIVKFQEITGELVTPVTLSSDILPFYGVEIVTPLEETISATKLGAGRGGAPQSQANFTIGAREIVCLRIHTRPRDLNATAWCLY